MNRPATVAKPELSFTQDLVLRRMIVRAIRSQCKCHVYTRMTGNHKCVRCERVADIERAFPDQFRAAAAFVANNP